MTRTALATPVTLASAARPVVARERGPAYAAEAPDEDLGRSGPEPGGLEALIGAADPAVVGAALAGLPAERLGRVVAAAVGPLDGRDAAGVVAAGAAFLGEDAARRLCGSLLSALDDAGRQGVAEDAVAALGRRSLTPGALPDADLHESWRALHRLERRVVAEKYRRLREINERGSSVTEGARTALDLLVRHGLTRGEAREQVDTAAALGELPKTQHALAEGAIGPGQAAEAGKALHEAKQSSAGADGTVQDDDTRAAAAAEIDAAVADSPSDADRRAVRERLERQAAQRSKNRLADREKRAYRHRYGRKFRDGDGLTLQFHGPAAAVQTIWTMIEALSRGTGAGDEHIPEQRRFDALRHVADRYLREGGLPDVMGHSAQVLLITTHDAQHDADGAVPSSIDGFGPVSSETARMICCDAEITVVVTGDDGQPLRLGRTRYQPNRAQRRAVAARDRVCIGCGADALHSEVHHVRVVEERRQNRHRQPRPGLLELSHPHPPPRVDRLA